MRGDGKRSIGRRPPVDDQASAVGLDALARLPSLTRGQDLGKPKVEAGGLKGLNTGATGAFLILLLYTAAAGYSLLNRSPAAQGSNRAREAAEVDAARLRLAAEGAAALYAARPGDPLDAAELATRLARPRASAAVIEGDEVLAVSGKDKAKDWRSLAKTTPGSPTAAAVRDPHTGAHVVVAMEAAPFVSSPLSSGALSKADLFILLAPLGFGSAALILFLRTAQRGERRRVAFEAQERRFRLAVEAARCGIWEWDLRQDRVILSDVTAVMFGWGGAGEVSGDDVLERIDLDHRARVRQALSSARSFGAFDVSFAVVTAAGDRAWIDARGQSPAAPDAMGYASLIGVAVDVTSERSAQLRAQSAESRMQDAIESVSEAFVLWDRRGRLILCNNTYRDFFKLEAKVLKPGASHRDIQKIVALAIKRQTETPGRRGLREAELADGRWVQINERRTADGGLVMTASNITDLKLEATARLDKERALQEAVARLRVSEGHLRELADKYRDAKIRAEGANRAKSGFLANMSHELRTPLNAILGFSEMMMTQMFGALGDRRYLEYAHDIHASGQHLLQLINDVLDMSKIEAGKLTLHLEEVDLAEMIADSVRLMRNRAETSDLTLTTEAPATLPLVWADQRAVKQILLNLISNAVKFTPKDGTIVVQAAVEGGEVGVRVIDSGIGIAAEDLSRLGRPFEQVETQHAKSSHGTGLGLALTKSLVAMHQGRFTLESAPGLGTTAAFTLPIAAVQNRAAASERGVAAA